MDTPQHIATIRQEGKLLADAARRSGLDADVPGCPTWDVRELVRHQGMIHLWAAAHVAFPHEDIDYESEDDELADFARYWPGLLGASWPTDNELIDWYQRTNDNLVDVLESASPDVEAWTFLPAPTPLAMWARRQAHETSIHRFDAEDASGENSGFEADLADDGIDELVVAFATRGKSFPVESESTMLIHATDTGTKWHVTMSPEGITTFKGSGPADVTISGTASDLYLAVWNRGDDSLITVEGDRSVLEAWHHGYRVRWS